MVSRFLVLFAGDRSELHLNKVIAGAQPHDEYTISTMSRLLGVDAVVSANYVRQSSLASPLSCP